MRRLLEIFFVLFICLSITGQNSYKWINQQYDASDMSENNLVEIQHVHGEIKQIYEYIDYEGFGTVGELSKIISYNEEGLITHYTNYLTSIDYKTINIVYDQDNNIVNQFETLVDKSDTIYKAKRMDKSIWILNEIYIPDSIQLDSNQNTVAYFNGGDVTFTRYDNYQRKICDSIPGSGQTMAHTITYDYEPNKIIKSITYLSSGEREIISYILDDKGNWIEEIPQVIEGSRFVNTRKRLIQYYE